ncbi:MAG: hypothetical protein V7K90_03745 [Nostoc sp.]|uniref:hypothetical protein n=1 Tax=Nostoc sp. TaxID=1180 RepID=UPI002FFCEA0B
MQQLSKLLFYRGDTYGEQLLETLRDRTLGNFGGVIYPSYAYASIFSTISYYDIIELMVILNLTVIWL